MARTVSNVSLCEQLDDDGADWGLTFRKFPKPDGGELVCAAEKITVCYTPVAGFQAYVDETVEICSINSLYGIRAVLQTRLHRSERSVRDRIRAREAKKRRETEFRRSEIRAEMREAYGPALRGRLMFVGKG